MIHSSSRRSSGGFSFVEVAVTIAIVAFFGMAAFATNQRLLIALKSQKETLAASMVLQERMEAFRGISYSNVASSSYVQNSILTFNPAASPSPTPTPPANGNYATYSEGALGSLKETVTVSGYQAASGYSPVPASDYNQWIRDTSTGAAPTVQNTNANLATNYDLIKVDILLTWKSANGRSRTRELAAVFGKGNIGQ